MGNPKIKIPLQPIDWVLNLVCLLGLMALFVLPWYYYHQLPEVIPSHFGISGDPDGYSGKKSIWTFPVLGIVTYLSMSFAVRFPNRFNYLQKITEKNAYRQYALATRMIRVLNTLTILIFLYFVHKSIQIGLGNDTGIGTLFPSIFILSILGFVMYSFSQAIRKDED